MSNLIQKTFYKGNANSNVFNLYFTSNKQIKFKIDSFQMKYLKYNITNANLKFSIDEQIYKLLTISDYINLPMNIDNISDFLQRLNFMIIIESNFTIKDDIFGFDNNTNLIYINFLQNSP
jgi:hypothetical protein